MTVRHSLALTGLVLSVANAVAVLTPTPGAVRLPLVLLFAGLGPGAAIITHTPIADAVLGWAVALVLSLTSYAGLSAIMAWSAWWHPDLTHLSLVALTASSCLAALVAALRAALIRRRTRTVRTRSARP